jgi:NAD(P)-dependent dehydrogenase (short-subunit alcohol dehydrogenase family)
MPPYSAFDDMPDLSGKVFLVTGANRGCGLECTRAFLRKGAEVVMACRNESNALAAISLLARDQSLPRGATDKAHYMHLDLGDLESVRKFSEQFLSSFDRLDCLLNNAGLLVDFSDMTKAWTVDGFERTIGVNYVSPAHHY